MITNPDLWVLVPQVDPLLDESSLQIPLILPTVVLVPLEHSRSHRGSGRADTNAGPTMHTGSDQAASAGGPPPAELRYPAEAGSLIPCMCNLYAYVEFVRMIKVSDFSASVYPASQPHERSATA